MRLTLLLALILAACSPSPPVTCITHSLEVGGLVECG